MPVSHLITNSKWSLWNRSKSPSVKQNVLNLQSQLPTFHYPWCTVPLVLFCSALNYRKILTNCICRFYSLHNCASEIIHHLVSHWGWTSSSPRSFFPPIEVFLVLRVLVMTSGHCVDNGVFVRKLLSLDVNGFFLQQCSVLCFSLQELYFHNFVVLSWIQWAVSFGEI